jgi:hypothetical protein
MVGPLVDILLTSYCDWTEYSLYLAAARESLVARSQRVGGRPGGVPTCTPIRRSASGVEWTVKRGRRPLFGTAEPWLVRGRPEHGVG